MNTAVTREEITEWADKIEQAHYLAEGDPTLERRFLEAFIETIATEYHARGSDSRRPTIVYQHPAPQAAATPNSKTS